MVDGEMYGCVKSFCYLEDTLDGDGGVDSTATARIRNGYAGVILLSNDTRHQD